MRSIPDQETKFLQFVILTVLWEEHSAPSRVTQLSMEGKSKAGQAALRITNLNNAVRLWGFRAVPGCLSCLAVISGGT